MSDDLTARLIAQADEADKAISFMTDQDLAEDTAREIALLREAAAVLTQQEAAWDAMHVEVFGQIEDDALAYVEMRQDVLGSNDPLVILADIVKAVRRAYLDRAALTGVRSDG